MQTVTMLFTDIEGSTRLLDQLGPRYTEVLVNQRTLLRAAFSRWHGREMGTEGDSFFVVFGSATDAVQAAVEGQRAVVATAWPDGVRVGVRMGLHTGEPTPHEDGYVGMDVHRAARIGGSAHGGQVVISETTYRIATHQRLDGLQFVGLGQHRLKDVPGAEHLYQVAGADLPQDFPPLRSLGAGSRLPVAATSLVGRDGELALLEGLLTEDGVRLLTLTGPGGSGKTRLAVAVASRVEPELPDGVYFVPLESVATTEAMWTTVGEVLGVSGESRALPNLLTQIASRRALLVLDNLEQLEDACSVVSQLLAAAPSCQVLATSRRPLHCAGEFEHAVPPLTLPAQDATAEVVAGCGAVQLFVQRARMVRPSFALDPGNADDVGEICRSLDGLPLALELAAARVKMLGARAVRARLDRSLELTTTQSHLPDRQRTLRATIDWSYALLSPLQQRAFRHLGVFRGSFGAQAAAAVLADGNDPLTHIAELLDLNLLEVAEGPDGEPRARLLVTISTYAREQLVAAGEVESASRRHAEHYLQVATAESSSLRGGDYLGSRDRIESDLDNFRAALEATLAVRDQGPRLPQDLETGLALCERLAWFWYACGYQGEGRRWTSLAVKAAAGRESPELMATLHMLGVLMLQHGEVTQGQDALQTCLAFWRRDGDLRMIARELNSLGVAHRALNDQETARELLAESIEISRRIGDPERLASALVNLSMIESDTGDNDLAIELLQEARALDAARGDEWGLGVDDVNLASLMLRGGRLKEAHEQLHRHAASAVALGDPDLTADVLAIFCCVFAEYGDTERAARLLGAMQALRRQAELPMSEPDAVALDRSVNKVRSEPPSDRWQQDVERGSTRSVQDALGEALAVRPPS